MTVKKGYGGRGTVQEDLPTRLVKGTLDPRWAGRTVGRRTGQLLKLVKVEGDA